MKLLVLLAGKQRCEYENRERFLLPQLVLASCVQAFAWLVWLLCIMHVLQGNNSPKQNCSGRDGSQMCLTIHGAWHKDSKGVSAPLSKRFHKHEKMNRSVFRNKGIVVVGLASYCQVCHWRREQSCTNTVNEHITSFHVWIIMCNYVICCRSKSFYLIKMYLEVCFQ